jgi:uncharacterized protein involved in exopolysaccharide biosynthesis
MQASTSDGHEFLPAMQALGRLSRRHFLAAAAALGAGAPGLAAGQAAPP